MKYFSDILGFSQEKDSPYETEDCIRYEFKLLDLHHFANPDTPEAHESLLKSWFYYMQRYILCTKAHDPVDLHPVAKPETPKANHLAGITKEDMKELQDSVKAISKLPLDTRNMGFGTTTTDIALILTLLVEKCSRRERNGKKNVHLRFETTEGDEVSTVGILKPTLRSKEKMRLTERAFDCKFGKEVLDKISERLEVRKYEARRRKQVRVKVASDTV
ncbi:uncharacterized protein J4E78_009163 [Alternaria triticimaculans]|uniref:uncharacterized protein n=1 Tax=Alternaria triticimaculans TaxID=297637 RepID=UPI0020C5720D|nr:uncharacterized protein J4E78_009163 [Alternaria triticimaculans]KAI4646242.1 hypothetical protein J4E78_009163 [Alternaria triticimaculans]